MLAANVIPLAPGVSGVEVVPEFDVLVLLPAQEHLVPIDDRRKIEQPPIQILDLDFPGFEFWQDFVQLGDQPRHFVNGEFATPPSIIWLTRESTLCRRWRICRKRSAIRGFAEESPRFVQGIVLSELVDHGVSRRASVRSSSFFSISLFGSIEIDLFHAFLRLFPLVEGAENVAEMIVQRRIGLVVELDGFPTATGPRAASLP